MTGSRTTSLEGQIKSDGKSVQAVAGNFNNKSIQMAKFPGLAVSGDHAYSQIFSVGSGDGSSVSIMLKDGVTGDALATTVNWSGTTDRFAKRTVIDSGSVTDTHDQDGSIQSARFVPGFLLQVPESLPLKGDETKSLGATGNVYVEYLWLMLVNGPDTQTESRTVQVYRLVEAKCIDEGASFGSATPAECNDPGDKVVS